MKTMASLALAVVLGFTAAPTVKGADGKTNAAPKYDVSTETDVVVTVADIREVPKGEPLGGVHLMVKAKSETVDVYVAPADFVKIFDFSFKKGQEIEVTGSKVKYNGETVILAREIEIGETALLLRDKDGTPYWSEKEPIPTGY